MSKKTTTRKKRRVLAPSQKYEMWVALLTGQGTQREVAAKYGVDRSTVVSVCRAAKEGALAAQSARPGRPGMSLEQVELAEAKAEIERLAATVTEQAGEVGFDGAGGDVELAGDLVVGSSLCHGHEDFFLAGGERFYRLPRR